MFHPKTMDFSMTKTFSAHDRHNLVRIDNLRTPGSQEDDLFHSTEFDVLIDRLRKAKAEKKAITCFIGAHVIKCGLSRYLIWLMENGYVTHLASNGAGSIHDFELAYLGGTSEHVPTAIEDGSFGMWEETGRWMNEAIQIGAQKGYGYGESLASFVEANPERFPYREDCVFYRAFQMGIPATYHVTMGTDIIHQHPAVDFAALGLTSGRDFNYFCRSVIELDPDGVHMNIGSAVTGAEVFLKALSIARNQGHRLEKITTANFDIIPLGDYKSDISKDRFEYYYRPPKEHHQPPCIPGRHRSLYLRKSCPYHSKFVCQVERIRKMEKVTLTRDEVIAISEKIKQVKICLIGDICLDMYWHADMKKSKLSRETPHYPLPVVEERYSPGAGGNVVQNIHALGVKKLVAISAISDDWRGFLLKKWMHEHGIDTTNLLLRNCGVTPCYCKPLRSGISDVVYEDPRIDFENQIPLTATEEDQLIHALDSIAGDVDMIAVSDQFAFGAITPRIREHLSKLAVTLPVVADSRENIRRFRNMIIKPNEVEAAAAIGEASTSADITPERYANIATRLQETTGRPVIITLGSLGALWCEKGTCVLSPAVPAKEPLDIVGAGDTFLSAFCCAYAACKSGPKALAYANLASAVTVKKIGTTGTASTEEILKKWEEQVK